MTTINLQEMLNAYANEELVTLPAGEYRLEVIRASVRNDNGIMPTYKVVGGPYAGKLVIIGQFTLTEAARSIFFRNLKGFGLEKDFIAQCQGLQDVANALVGRVVDMTVEVREWKGEDRNQMPIGGAKLVSVGGGPADLPTPAAPAAKAPAPGPAAGGSMPPPPPAGGVASPGF